MTGNEVVNLTAYFWENYQNLERCTQYDEMAQYLQANHPNVLRAYENYKNAIRTMNLECGQMCSEHEWEDTI